MADPDRVPYYLLLVGDPEDIPYALQYDLDVNYAVGRIYFETPDDYRRYAESVVSAEALTSQLLLPQRAIFFGVKHEDDYATLLMSKELVEPLTHYASESASDWEIQALLGPEARKERLGRILGGEETPAFLFTASHGLSFDKDDDRQAERQGAIVCHDWSGPKAGRPTDDAYFCAQDVPDAARLHGLIAFLFTGYSVGTPERDDFHSLYDVGRARRLAHQAFVARLPQRLLSHPGGGASAVIGHIDRAWTTSFSGEGIDVFRGFLRRLLQGNTVGWAMEYFNQAHASLAAQLNTMTEGAKRGESVDMEALDYLRKACHDIRNFAVFGDPAVRLLGGKARRRNVS